jgi:hypothetical protein
MATEAAPLTDAEIAAIKRRAEEKAGTGGMWTAEDDVVRLAVDLMAARKAVTEKAHQWGQLRRFVKEQIVVWRGHSQQGVSDQAVARLSDVLHEMSMIKASLRLTAPADPEDEILALRVRLAVLESKHGQ